MASLTIVDNRNEMFIASNTANATLLLQFPDGARACNRVDPADEKYLALPVGPSNNKSPANSFCSVLWFYHFCN